MGKRRPNRLAVAMADRESLQVEKLDQLDRRLIELLQVDGRQPNTELARKLDVTEGTVRNRIAKLLNDDLIQVGAWVDPVRIGGQIYAHIEVQAEFSRIDAVARQIANYPEIIFEGIATGNSDIFLACVFRSTQHMDDFVTRQLAAIKGIRRTASYLVLRIVKRHYRFPSLAKEKAPNGRSGKAAVRAVGTHGGRR